MHEPRLRGTVGAERMRVLLSSGLLEMERAVAEVRVTGGFLSPAGLEPRGSGDAHPPLPPLWVEADGNIKWREGKARK